MLRAHLQFILHVSRKAVAWHGPFHCDSSALILVMSHRDLRVSI